MAELKRGAIFISGWGSNLQVFLDQKDQFKSLLVVSSSQKAFGLKRAKDHNVDTLVLGSPIDWQGLTEALISKEIDFIFCAGFMKIIPASFLNQWENPIYNLHPSLLPKYKGLKAIERAYEENDDIGVSIHTLVAEVDSGQVVLQDKVLEKDSYSEKSVDEVRELIQQKEHQMVSLWIEKYLPNRLNHS